ncbi:MAG: hypothetical protein R2854_05525 [Caldilineaceae bacterium]
MVTSIACGIILNSLPLATGYQVIFTIGFIGDRQAPTRMWKLRHPGGDGAADPVAPRRWVTTPRPVRGAHPGR